jgi:serine/threonine-protein kinase HipA
VNVPDHLAVLLAGRDAGELRRDRRGRVRFAYSTRYRDAPESFALSVSMPLSAKEHGPGVVEPFLWGLVPDNEVVLEKRAAAFGVSGRDAFGLLAHTGEDCAGAVQIVVPGRREDLLDTGRRPHVQWLTESDVGERLRLLRSDHAAGRKATDLGQFSLAGAQPKTALLCREGRWGVPSGRMPTTHILKPPTDLDGHVHNEHFCLTLARELGLPVASSEVRSFDGEIAIVVQRYDRADTPALAAAAAAEAASLAATSAGDRSIASQAALASAAAAARAAVLSELAKTQPILRLHQEDACQALGVHPSLKYQKGGGPSPRRIADLLEESSARPGTDVASFADALLYNWLIAGTDAHAKNYSVLHLVRGRVRLAPFYDLASALGYERLRGARLELAMKLGRTYRADRVGSLDLAALAKELRIDAEALLARARQLAVRLREVVPTVARNLHDAGLSHPIVPVLERELVKRAKKCAAAIGARG